MWYKGEAEFKAANGYDMQGTWYPRVTRILEVKSKPALDQFFKEMESYAAAEEVKTKSAAQGTMVHTTIEKIVRGETDPVPDQIRPAVEAFQAFNENQKIVFHPEFIERSVRSLKYKYAGTVDALATVDGKFGVLDIKTSSGFYNEYNLQTAAYMLALSELEIKKELALPRPVETRWILRINQQRSCMRCGATLREKGGRAKIKNGFVPGRKTKPSCPEVEHAWSEVKGDVELKEFPYDIQKDMRAFMAAKILWEWENGYWLKKIGYGGHG